MNLAFQTKKTQWHFAVEREETHVGRDFSRFSLSSNVTRLAKLQEEGFERKEGSELADFNGRVGEEGDTDTGCFVRWQVCSSAVPGMVRGLFHLSEQSNGPEPTGRSQPTGQYYYYYHYILGLQSSKNLSMNTLHYV